MASFNINAVDRRIQYTSTGQTAFNFSFQVNASSELQVYINDVLKTETKKKDGHSFGFAEDFIWNFLDNYDNDHFETGDLAAGFLFNTDEIKYPNGIFITNGGLEFVYDFTPVAELNYSSPGSSNVNIARLDNYSEQNIRGNIGFEFVYLSGFTFSMNYERYQSINSIRNSHTDTLLIKFSHLVDEDNEFAFNFDPLKNNLAQLNYSKNINGFDVKFNIDADLTNKNQNSNILINKSF